MNKDELRPCIVKFVRNNHRYELNTAPDAGENTVEFKRISREECETHKGYFHKWSDDKHGIVEYEDGTVHEVPPDCIIFVDRQNASVNVCADEMARAVTGKE